MDTEDDPDIEVPGRTDADSGEAGADDPGEDGDGGSDPGDGGDEEVASMYEQSGSTEDPMAELRESIESDDSDGDDSGSFDAPLLDGDDEPETSAGTFYVKYAQESAVTLHEVNTAQICTLIENPGFETHDIVEATLVAQPPMQVSYLVEELEDHYSIPIERSPEPPTQQVRGVAGDIDEGEAVAIEREGEGEIHILRVPPEQTAGTAEELDEDEMTYKNAARYGATRVEIRTDEAEGVVSIRYLP
jgi:hypothetical protein